MASECEGRRTDNVTWISRRSEAPMMPLIPLLSFRNQDTAGFIEKLWCAKATALSIQHSLIRVILTEEQNNRSKISGYTHTPNLSSQKKQRHLYIYKIALAEWYSVDAIAEFKWSLTPMCVGRWFRTKGIQLNGINDMWYIHSNYLPLFHSLPIISVFTQTLIHWVKWKHPYSRTATSHERPRVCQEESNLVNLNDTKQPVQPTLYQRGNFSLPRQLRKTTRVQQLREKCSIF